MSENVIEFPGPTLLDIPCDKILNSAIEAKLGFCVVIGETQDGEIFTATSTGDLADIILALELAKSAFMKQAFE